MRNIAFIALAYVGSSFWNSPIAGPSLQTNICIVNLTPQTYTITVADIVNYHWDGNGRPDKNFNNVTISPNERVCRREEINWESSTWRFTFLIDGAPTEVSMNMTGTGGCALNAREATIQAGQCSVPSGIWRVKTITRNQKALYGEYTTYNEDPNWWNGYKCSSGEKCSEFQIRSH